jgi:mRNA interferase MazF
MKRGEIWTVAGGNGYTGKPRPAIIVQDDAFDATASVTICALTTDATEAPLFRLAIEPSLANGLRVPCRLMVDKITTVPRARLGRRVGRLDDEDLVRLHRAALVFLGLATTRRRKANAPRKPARR